MATSSRSANRVVSPSDAHLANVPVQVAPATGSLAARVAIERAVTHVFGVDYAALSRFRRGRQPVSNARQVAMYVAHVACGMSLTDVGRLFGRDRTTVAHACLRTEMRRDDPRFDQAIDLLVWAVPVMVRRPDLYDIHR